jgi:hypothetical protein
MIQPFAVTIRRLSAQRRSRVHLINRHINVTEVLFLHAIYLSIYLPIHPSIYLYIHLRCYLGLLMKFPAFVGIMYSKYFNVQPLSSPQFQLSLFSRRILQATPKPECLIIRQTGSLCLTRSPVRQIWFLLYTRIHKVITVTGRGGP